MTGDHAAHCRWLTDLLARHEGDEDALERLITVHIEACPECSSEERRLASLLRRYGSNEPPEISASLEDRILDLICHGADAPELPPAQ